MMRAGKLRHRVKVQEAARTQNSRGEVTLSYMTGTPVWAEVSPLSGTELERAGQIASEATHQVRMRHFDGLDSAKRILFGTRTFEIVEPPRNTDERDVELVLLCKEIA